MPGYFRFLTIMAFHVYLKEKVSFLPTFKGLIIIITLKSGVYCNLWHFNDFSCHHVMHKFVLQVDVAVLEVGIGGSFDCTNVIRCVCYIANVANLLLAHNLNIMFVLFIFIHS